MKIFLDLFDLEHKELLEALKDFIDTNHLPNVEINKIGNFYILAYPFTRIINSYFQLTTKVGYFYPLKVFLKIYGKVYTHFFIKYSPVKLVKKNNFKGINFLSFQEDKVVYLEKDERKDAPIDNFYISFPYYFFKIFSKTFVPPYKPFVKIKKQILNEFLKKFSSFIKKNIKFSRIFVKNCILPPELNWEKLYNLVLFKKPFIYPSKAEVFIICDSNHNFEVGKSFLSSILENKKVNLKIKKIKISLSLFENEKNTIKLIKSLSKIYFQNIQSTFLILFENLDFSKFIRNIIVDGVIIDPNYLSSSDFKYRVHKALNILNLLGFQIYSLPGLRNFKRIVNVIDYPKKYLLNIFENGIIKNSYFIEKKDRTFLDFYKDSIFILPFNPDIENLTFLRYFPTNLPDYFPKSLERGYLIFEDFIFKYYFSFWKENSISFVYGDINLLPYIIEGLVSNNAVLPLRYKNVEK